MQNYYNLVEVGSVSIILTTFGVVKYNICPLYGAVAL